MGHGNSLRHIHINLAQHYLKKLAIASAAYRKGYENTTYGLTLFDQEWPQIRHWWQWVNNFAYSDDQLAQLSMEYSLHGEEIFNFRQTPQERFEWAKAGLVAAQQINDQQAEGACLFRMAWAMHKQDISQDTEVMAYSALNLAESSRDWLQVGRILHLLGEISIRHGCYAQAWDFCSRSLDLLLGLHAEVYLLDTYFALSEIAYLQGDLKNAYDYALQSLHLLETHGFETSLGSILNWVGVLSFELGDYELGEYYILQSIENGRVKGSQSEVAHGLCALGYLEVCRQQYSRAEQYFEESFEIARSTGEAWLIRIIELEQAYLLSKMGHRQTAQQNLYRAVEYGRNSGYHGHLAQALNYLADLQIDADQLDLAPATLVEGLQIARDDGNRLEITRGLLVAAKFAQRCGRLEQAVEWLGLLLSQSSTIAPISDAGQSLAVEIERELDGERFQRAFQDGKVLDFDAAIENILNELKLASTTAFSSHV
ncbi:MAG: hypothetical protein HY862_09930 [Chloroflexi bacterium]|nr:hypothetical protein [Chloroflexota bacterium]